MSDSAPGTSEFRVAEPLLLRLAAAPAAGLDDVQGLDPDAATLPEVLAAIASLVERAELRHAVEVASPDLSTAIDRAEQGQVDDLAKARRVLSALTRYALRLHHRPTPFGTFAGVAPAGLGAAHARVGDRHRPVVRADAGWAHDLAAASPAGLLIAEPGLQRRGGRVVVPAHADRATQSRSVARNAVLDEVLLRAHVPVERMDLAQLVRDRVPGATDTAAQDYLTGLVLAGVLVNGDRRDPLVEHPAVTNLVREYEKSSPAHRRPTWQAAVIAARALRQHPTPFHVDLRMDAELVLPQEVAREAASAARALWRLSPDQSVSPQLDDYHLRFLERYGTDRLVPLFDLLDPHRGLGAPEGYRWPGPDRSSPPPTVGFSEDRDALLAQEITGADELELTDDLLEALSPECERPPPRGLDLGFTVHADDVDGLRDGNWLLAVSTGAMAAGASLGRFAGAAGLHDGLHRLLDRGQADVVAEMIAPTATPDMANVAPAAHALDAIVETAVVSARPPRSRIDARDIAVGSNGSRFYAVDTRSSRTLDVIRLNMLYAERALPDAARLLASLDLVARRPWTGWDWGRLSVLPRLPRVRLGRVVLAPALLRPGRDLLDSAGDPGRFERAVRRQTDALGWDGHLVVGDTDQRLELDVRRPWHRELLRERLRRSGSPPTLQETPSRWCAAHGITAPYGITDGHAAEVVMPILTPESDTPVAPSSVPWTSLRTTQPRFLPGGPWTSWKLYAEDSSIETVLRAVVDATGPDATSATRYVVRYADPEVHLRVRIRTAPGEACFAALQEWVTRACSTGQIRTAVLDEYAPEVDRYGGPEAMAVAEHLFAADTELVAHLLSKERSGVLDLPRTTVAALSQWDLLQCYADTDDVLDWIRAVIPAALAHRVPAARRRAFARLLTDESTEWQPDIPLAPRAALARQHAGLVGPLRGAGHSSAVAVLHLHCNRLLGLSRDAEQFTHGLLRAAADALEGRRRAGR